MANCVLISWVILILGTILYTTLIIESYVHSLVQVYSVHPYLYMYAFMQRAVVTMSRETERNISQILNDVRRHSNASQTSIAGASDTCIAETGMTSSGSYASSSATSMTGSASTSQLQDFDDSLSASVWTGEEEGFSGMEIEPSLTDETGMTGSARLSSENSVDTRYGKNSDDPSANSERMFFIDNEGEGRSSIEEELRRRKEEVDKLNQALKSELEDKEENNARYKKMMVSLCVV